MPVSKERVVALLVEAIERQNATMAQTSKEKQEAFRARQTMLGMTEVRGIYLPPELHAELKAYARKLAKKAEKRGNDAAGSRTEPSGSEAD